MRDRMRIIPEPTMTFFEPDREMVQWLSDYAGDRIIFDIGSGTGHLLRELKKIGNNKTIGIEPRWRFMLSSSADFIQVLPYEVGDPLVSKIVERTDDALFIIARPSHSGFPEKAIEIAGKHEVLYITRAHTREEYMDLGKYDKLAELIPHKGSSKDKELVWRIKR